MTTHVKAVLARSAQARTTPNEKATTIAFLGVKGGLGTTTMALNVAIGLQSRSQEVILAELNPGRGTIGLDLGIPSPLGLGHLLARALNDIHLRSVDGELVTHKSGVRLLLSSYRPRAPDMASGFVQPVVS